ncbi:RarD protein [Saprolegnia diclina VS20]|uniref:RarD protein n=1 Tax=Saprolegnia diclina (strain VS20) TaxID=1156394 RepID=T0Q7T7_SAPDV|nr:RarD protein [Saprolegnia diclina VS20]EQC33929.1 RarD protein [Saprolegnia diclina VS20]|eukprot:XP_008612724.1 RarD protein [Saprolegnia diclina VS20]
MRTGILHGVLAFLFWGFMPIYWKQVESIPAVQLALHRIVWSLLILVLILVGTGRWSDFRAHARGSRIIVIYTIASIFVFANWALDIWAVNAGFIVETSLGYFITPLFNVLFGVALFKERPRVWQWISIALATSGVLVCAIDNGTFPWVALSLAITFSIYSVAKKQAPLNALYGLTLETAILFPPAIVYLVVLEIQGTGALGRVSVVDNFLLVGCGVCTIIPLLLFASAAQRISISLLGMLQYIFPSVMFVIGVVLYNEPFSMTKLIGFILVWVAVAMYSVEEFVYYKNHPKEAAVVQTPRDDVTPFERV